MTSNLGTEFMNKQAAIGFANKDAEAKIEKLKENVMNAVEKHFKPEFINRIDKIIVFNPLDKESIRKIVDIQIGDLNKRLSQNKIKLKIGAQVKDWIADKGFTPQFGARPIRKVITEHIETPLSEGMLMEKFSSGDVLELKISGDKIKISKRA